MLTTDATDRISAARVGAAAQLLDVRLRKVRGELESSSPRSPIQLEIGVEPSVVQVDDLVIYEIEYEIRSTDADENSALTALIGLSLVYRLEAGFEPKSEDLAAFGRVSVLYTAHPYLREILQSMASRMGLPSLVLDVLRSPLDDELVREAEEE